VDTPWVITYSRVASYRRCPRQYWLEYESGQEKPPEPVSPAGIVGSAVHRALNALAETGDAGLGRHELETYLRMPAHAIAGPGTEYARRAHALYDAGCAAHASIQSLECWAERDTYRPYPAGGITVWAKVDRIDRLSALRWQVTDWKTGWGDDDDATDAQLDLAHVALRTTFAWIPAEATVQAVAWNLQTGRHRVRELVAGDVEPTLQKYAAFARRLKGSTEYPATAGTHCRFCRWRAGCPEGTAFLDVDMPGGDP
jgi:RecB family exonuclease